MNDATLDEFAFGDDFAVFQHFQRPDDLNYTEDLLRRHGIPYRVGDEQTGAWREATIMGSPLQPRFWIEIPAHSFSKARYILEEEAELTITDEYIAEHPFSKYSLAELKRVLIDNDAWNPEAVVVARRLLIRSGQDVDLVALRAAARKEEVKRYAPRAGSRLVIIGITLLGTLSGLALWFLFLTLCAGVLLHFTVGSRRDARGERHLEFDEATRRAGLFGLVVVGLGFAVGLLNRIYLQYYYLPAFDFYF